jgi:hypothetical protein
MEGKVKRPTVLLAASFLLLAAATLLTVRADAQQSVVTAQNLNQMIANAKTPADHEAIAAYYDKEATENEKMVELHRASKNIYTKTPNQLHCNALIKSYQAAANADKALAAGHRQMAEKLKGSQ